MNPAKRDRDPVDPKHLIREAFRIEGISAPECRSIFVDWALSIEAADPKPLIETLLQRHADQPEDHPMKRVLTEAAAFDPPKGRRGGRAARLSRD